MQSKIMWSVRCKECKTDLEDQYLTRDEFDKFLEVETCGECGGKLFKPLGVGAVKFNCSGMTKRGT